MSEVLRNEIKKLVIKAIESTGLKTPDGYVNEIVDWACDHYSKRATSGEDMTLYNAALSQSVSSQIKRDVESGYLRLIKLTDN